MSSQTLYILVVLYVKESHGYEIMKQVEKFSNGTIRMGPGTLYGAIKRLLEEGLIEETESIIEANRKRRMYKITEKGKAFVSAELHSLNNILEIAKNSNILFAA